MDMGGLTKPVTNLAQKASKTQNIKAIKLKVKFGAKQPDGKQKN